MEKSIQEKFDQVLQDVRDPESNLPISDFGVVKKFRYNEEQRRIYVFVEFQSHRPACVTCVGISLAIENTIERKVKEELEKQFPGFTVEFVAA
ncbi:MAG: hypothetical protein ACP5IA_07805 [Sediminispirochaetaceae bacterium]